MYKKINKKNTAHKQATVVSEQFWRVRVIEGNLKYIYTKGSIVANGKKKIFTEIRLKIS